MNRITVERRHREFSSLYRSQSVNRAAVQLIAEAGWEFKSDSWVEGMIKGWWVNRHSDNYNRPMGDAREFFRAAFTTVQLYTDIDYVDLVTRADQLRNEEFAEMYKAAA